MFQLQYHLILSLYEQNTKYITEVHQVCEEDSWPKALFTKEIPKEIYSP